MWTFFLRALLAVLFGVFARKAQDIGSFRAGRTTPWTLFLLVPRHPAVTCSVLGTPEQYMLDLL